MARAKKNGTYLNVCIDTILYDELSAICEEAGQTKTVAVERALTEYLEHYRKRLQMLRDLEVKDGTNHI